MEKEKTLSTDDKKGEEKEEKEEEELDRATGPSLKVDRVRFTNPNLLSP